MQSLARMTFGVGCAACALALVVPRLGVAGLGRTAFAPVAPAVASAGPASDPAWTGIEIAADRVGQYHTEIRVDGFPISVLVDTGATFVSLTAADARRLGLNLADADYKYQVATANGVAAVAITTLHEVQIGGIRLYDVRATVAHGEGLGQSLLGMSFLGRLSKVEAANGRLILRP